MMNNVTQKEKAMLYVWSGCVGNDEETNKLIESSKAKIAENGKFELVGLYNDENDMQMQLIERKNELKELKSELQKTNGKYLIVPTLETLGCSLSSQADALKELKEVGVNVYVLDKGLDVDEYVNQQRTVTWTEFLDLAIGFDRTLQRLIKEVEKLELKK